MLTNLYQSRYEIQCALFHNNLNFLVFFSLCVAVSSRKNKWTQRPFNGVVFCYDWIVFFSVNGNHFFFSGHTTKRDSPKKKTQKITKQLRKSVFSVSIWCMVQKQKGLCWRTDRIWVFSGFLSKKIKNKKIKNKKKKKLKKIKKKK